MVKNKEFSIDKIYNIRPKMNRGGKINVDYKWARY